MESLALKYRPGTLDQVIGQPTVVATLRDAFAHQHIPHAVLFTGPSGVGKTTVARIIAANLNSDLVQVDAASFGGIETVRQLVMLTRYYPLGKPHRTIILEEVQGLTAPAWQALLLPLEEPATWMHWILCTTEPARIPETILTRCHRYSLRPVGRSILLDHLQQIARKEGLDVDPEVLELCVAQAKGSVRQALTNLETCRSCYRDRKAARVLLVTPIKAERKNGDAALVALVKQGHTREQIADQLHLSRTTVWRRLEKLISAGVISEDEIRRG